MKLRLVLPVLAVAGSVFALGLSGCGSNIGHIAPETAPVDRQIAFNASLDRVWAATQRALSEDDTVKVLDKSSGIMVTEFRTIDAKELSLAQTYFLGKTYKSSYTVNVTANGARTDVRVNVKLQAVQLALLAREESNEPVEGYLRKRLFERIAAQLGGSQTEADPRSAVPVAPAPAPAHRAAEPARTAPEPAAAPPRSPGSEVLTKEGISKAQLRLKEMGFDPGGTDGVLGPRSVAAIRRFQAAKKLPVTGRLTPETLTALGMTP